MKLGVFALFILLTILLVTTGGDGKATSTPTAIVDHSPTATSIPWTLPRKRRSANLKAITRSR